MAIYQSTIIGTQSTQTVQVTMGWSNVFGPSHSDAATLASEIAEAWNGLVLSVLQEDYQCSEVLVVGVDDPTVVASTPMTTGGGVTTSDAAPVFIVANTKIETGLRGRSYRGRFGIPGMPQSYIDPSDGNFLGTTYVGTLQAAINAFVANIHSGTTGSRLSVISRVSGGAPRPAPIATLATSWTVQQPFGSRISRKG